MKIDRRFTKLKKRSLLSFSIRILRNAALHNQLRYPARIMQELQIQTDLLDSLLQAIIIPRPLHLKDKIKCAEQEIMRLLVQLADYLEAQDFLKYDLFLTGFPLFTSKRKVS